MSDVNQTVANNMWQQAQEKVKDKVIAPSLYRALEMGVGLAVEGDEFVLGFSTSDLPMAGHLRNPRHQAIIEKSLSDLVGRKVTLKIVEGTTSAEYAAYKKRQAMADATRQTLTQQRSRERAVENAWEQVVEKITRGYARVQNRQFAQIRARYIMHCFKIMNEAVNEIGYTFDSDEMQQRAMARVWEKFSNTVDVPSSMLAYEFFKLRQEGKLK